MRLHLLQEANGGRSQGVAVSGSPSGAKDRQVTIVTRTADGCVRRSRLRCRQRTLCPL